MSLYIKPPLGWIEQWPVVVGHLEKLAVRRDPGIETLPWYKILHCSLCRRRHRQWLGGPRDNVVFFLRRRYKSAAIQEQDASSSTAAQQHVSTLQVFHWRFLPVFPLSAEGWRTTPSDAMALKSTRPFRPR